jgi:hypothetical protein
VPWIVHAPGARNRALRRAEIAEVSQRFPACLRNCRACGSAYWRDGWLQVRRRLSKRRGPMYQSSPCPILVRPMSATVLMSANGSRARWWPPGPY